MGFVLRFLFACLLIGGSAAAGAWFLGYLGEAQHVQERTQQVPPVIVADVKRKEFLDEIEAIGTTYANESITLAAPVTELISAVNFKDGEEVKKGDVLIRLATEVEEARLRAAKSTLAEAEKQLTRIDRLARQGNAAETRLDEQTRIRDTAKAEVARIEAEIERRIIRAPFDGVVGLRRISPGALVQPGTDLAALQDISVLKLDFNIPEIYLTALKPGQEIVARTPVYRDREFKGEISVVDPRVDPVSRAVAVRALLPNDKRELKPGMLMSVSVIRERARPIMIPEQSIVSVSARSFVFKLEADNKVRRVEIQTGRRTPGFVEIVSGLEEGDVIVVEGTIRVKDGMTVNPQKQNGSRANAGLAADLGKSG